MVKPRPMSALAVVRPPGGGLRTRNEGSKPAHQTILEAFLRRTSPRTQKVYREGLEALCDRFNAERERRGIRERYRIVDIGGIWKLETFIPYEAPSSCRAQSQHISQREIDHMSDDLLRLGVACGAIVRTPDGAFRPAGEN